MRKNIYIKLSLLLGCSLLFFNHIYSSWDTAPSLASPKLNALYYVNLDYFELHQGPASSYPHIKNIPASKTLKRDIFISIDNSVKIIIVDTTKTWSKIQVVDPTFLSGNHIGWIPSDFLLKL